MDNINVKITIDYTVCYISENDFQSFKQFFTNKQPLYHKIFREENIYYIDHENCRKMIKKTTKYPFHFDRENNYDDYDNENDYDNDKNNNPENNNRCPVYNYHFYDREDDNNLYSLLFHKDSSSGVFIGSKKNILRFINPSYIDAYNMGDHDIGGGDGEYLWDDYHRIICNDIIIDKNQYIKKYFNYMYNISIIPGIKIDCNTFTYPSIQTIGITTFRSDIFQDCVNTFYSHPKDDEIFDEESLLLNKE